MSWIVFLIYGQRVWTRLIQALLSQFCWREGHVLERISSLSHLPKRLCTHKCCRGMPTAMSRPCRAKLSSSALPLCGLVRATLRLCPGIDSQFKFESACCCMLGNAVPASRIDAFSDRLDLSDPISIVLNRGDGQNTIAKPIRYCNCEHPRLEVTAAAHCSIPVSFGVVAPEKLYHGGG